MRDIIFQIVFNVLEKGISSDVALEEAMKGKPRFHQVKRLAYGTIERKITCDEILRRVISLKVRDLDPRVRTILRMGIYERFWVDSVPKEVTCNEMANLTKTVGVPQYTGYVNGVLRTISKQEKDPLWDDILKTKKKDSKKLGFIYGMPEGIVTLFLNQYGKKTTVKILNAMEEPAPVYIRIQNSRIDEKEFTQELIRKGISYEPTILPGVLRLQEGVAVPDIPGFHEGTFMVQDLSSTLPVTVAGLKPSDTVVDLCACPGGKSIQAADLLGEKGRVIARDSSAKRMKRMKENITRMHLDSKIACQVWDGRKEDPDLKGKADVVLADVPCSGLGVMGRKPEIRFHALERVSQLIPMQREIVARGIQNLKPGGTLVYSTCTIHPEENEGNVRYFTEHFPLACVSLWDGLPKALQNGQSARGMLQILPGIREGNGFFVAKMRYKGNGSA